MNRDAPRLVRRKQLFGGCVLGAALVCGIGALLSPAVRSPAARVAAVLQSGLQAERSDDLVVALPTTAGLSAGLPAWAVDAAGDARPVAHVAAFGSGPEGAWVRLRFEPGEDAAASWTLHAHPPDRRLGAALEMGLTAEGAKRFGAEIATRLERLWLEALLPEAEQRWPAFLARIDPSEDTEARALLQGLSKSALTRLDPLLDDLATHVTSAIKEKFDMLDRVGLLWKVVKGDANGLQREVLPVAKTATQAWWTANEERVLSALGAALHEHRDDLQQWIGGELFEAARGELVEPILAAQRTRLEREGEAILRMAADAFVKAPAGGFRVRFASLLRTQLLRKDTALLLLEAAPSRASGRTR